MDTTAGEFASELASLGFVRTGSGRRAGTVWALVFNRHLTFTVHDHGERVLLSWAFGLGEYLEERGWRLSVTDTSTAELYPQHDVAVARDGDALRAEITRVLHALRLDLGDPDA